MIWTTWGGQRACLLFAAMLTLTYSMTAPRVETSKINNISLHSSAAFILFTKQIYLFAVMVTYPESTTNPLSTVSTVETLEKSTFSAVGTDTSALSTCMSYCIGIWSIIMNLETQISRKYSQKRVCFSCNLIISHISCRWRRISSPDYLKFSNAALIVDICNAKSNQD